MSRLRWLPAALAAIVLNGLLLAAAAVLSRERPLVQDMTDPVSVTLVSLERPAPPPERELRPEPPPPTPPRPDFTPRLPAPSLGRPAPLEVSVALDPALFAGELPRGEVVFEAADLDQAPRQISSDQPLYPYRARQRNLEGRVQVKFLVRADGSVDQVEILASEPPGLFDQSVLETVPRWRFRPGTIDGRPVPSWVAQWIAFTLER